MLCNLRNVGFSTEKVEVFNGSADKYDRTQHNFDFIFIDGEHTDFACFRDFIHTEKLLNKNSIVAFHDSTLVYKSLKIIVEYLKSQGRVFNFMKIKDI